MRITHVQRLLAEALLQDPTAEFYGYELSAQIGVDAGSLYATLYRWESQGLLTSEFESIDPAVEGRPPRKYYRLTGIGQHACRELLRAARARRTSLRPNLGTA